MDSTKTLVIGALIIILGGIGWYTFSREEASENTMMEKTDETMMEENGDAMMEEGDEAMKESDEMMMTVAGTYEAYAPEKLALAADGDVLLFFHATWCPVCRGIESEIESDPSVIPTGTHILKVNYDTEIALRQKYGVTVQHTFVQVDTEGKALQKFSDASTLSDVLSRVQ